MASPLRSGYHSVTAANASRADESSATCSIDAAMNASNESHGKSSASAAAPPSAPSIIRRRCPQRSAAAPHSDPQPPTVSASRPVCSSTRSSRAPSCREWNEYITSAVLIPITSSAPASSSRGRSPGRDGPATAASVR